MPKALGPALASRPGIHIRLYVHRGKSTSLSPYQGTIWAARQLGRP